MKEQVIYVQVLIEKRLRVVGHHTYITVRSKQSIEVPTELLQKGNELVDDKKFETIAKIDLVRVPIHSASLARGSYCDAIVVQNVLCENTTAAFMMAEELGKKDWNVIHMEGTQKWGKETSED